MAGSGLRRASFHRCYVRTVDLPLSALLSQALLAVTDEYQRRGVGSADVPTLAVWSNVIRPVGAQIELRELPISSRLSKRAVRAAVAGAENYGWLTRENKTLRPTAAAEAASDRWPALEAAVAPIFGGELPSALRDLVCQLHLEWPHYPTGYGPADHSITGGIYAGGGKTDSTVPTHAVDWSPVVRHDLDGSSVADLPLSALLSQAFVAFAADFEECWIGGLHLAASVLRLLPDEGMATTDIPMLNGLKGDGKSLLERHGYVEILRDEDNPKIRRAVPTTRGRATRDEYEPVLTRVESRWVSKYGAGVVSRLRAALESMNIDRSLPHSVIDTLAQPHRKSGPAQYPPGNDDVPETPD
jgi:hypothetical protein